MVVKELIYYTAFHKSIRHKAGESDYDDCVEIDINFETQRALLVKKNGFTTIINLNHCIAYSYKEIEGEI